MQSKLTLSIDPAVVAQAKQLARDSETSLSRLVENYLRQLIAQNEQIPTAGPVLQQITGILKELPGENYHTHLERKYL